MLGSFCSWLVVAGCSAGADPGLRAPGFNPADPTGTYSFELTLPDGEYVAGGLIVEEDAGPFHARTDIPNFVPLELPTVRTEPDRLVLEGSDPMGGQLRADLSFDGEEFSGYWEQMGEAVPIHGRISMSERAERVPNDPIRFSTFDELHEILTERADLGLFSGSVLVAEGEDILFRRNYGWAYRGNMAPATRRPVTADTRFDLGSLDKLFTSVSVLRLVQEGRIDLDAGIGAHLDDLGPNISPAITARQLLQHRAGLGDYLGHPDFRANPARFGTVDALMELVEEQAPEFEPGRGQLYSNSGFVVLGAVLESVMGRPYPEVVRELIFKPAGMTSTGGRPDDRSATGYSLEDGEHVSTEGRWPPMGSPAGGGHSTAEDLHRFMEALTTDRLLDERYTDTFLRFFEGPSEEPLDRQGPWSFGSTGNAPGLSTAVAFDAPSRRTIVVLMNLGDNHDPSPAGVLAESILDHGRSR